MVDRVTTEIQDTHTTQREWRESEHSHAHEHLLTMSHVCDLRETDCSCLARSCSHSPFLFTTSGAAGGVQAGHSQEGAVQQAPPPSCLLPLPVPLASAAQEAWKHKAQRRTHPMARAVACKTVHERAWTRWTRCQHWWSSTSTPASGFQRCTSWMRRLAPGTKRLKEYAQGSRQVLCTHTGASLTTCACSHVHRPCAGGSLVPWRNSRVHLSSNRPEAAQHESSLGE